MASTTIKVDTTVRDRLAVLARERGTTMGALLADAVDRLEREAFFMRAATQLSRLQVENPTEWHANREESRSCQRGTDADIANLDDQPGWWE